MPITEFWENRSIIWEQGIKQMDLVIKDDSGGQGDAHKRKDAERYFPIRVSMTVVQVQPVRNTTLNWYTACRLPRP